jgi:hypothetical protein
VIAMSVQVAFLWLLGAALPTLGRADGPIHLQVERAATGKYERIEFEIGIPTRYANPLDPDEVDVQLVLQAPDGREVRLPAFFMQPYERVDRMRSGRLHAWLYPSGMPGWRARFAPDQTGRYQAIAECRDANGTRRSAPVTFESTPSTNRGFVRVSRSDPRFFEFSEGQPFFPIGQNLAFIGESQLSESAARPVLPRSRPVSRTD